MYKYIATIFFFISTSAGAGLFGPDSHEECKFERIKECGDNLYCSRLAVELCDKEFPYKKTSDWELFKSGSLDIDTKFVPHPIDHYVRVVITNTELISGPKTETMSFYRSMDFNNNNIYSSETTIFQYMQKDRERYGDFIRDLNNETMCEYLNTVCSYIISGATYEIYHAKRERKAKGWFD